MRMEFGYEFDSLSDLPPLPQEFDARNYSSAITPLDFLPPFPPSDFAPSDKQGLFHLHLQQHCADSLFLDSTLSLLNHHHLTDSTRFHELFSDDVATKPFLHLPDLQSFEQTTTDVENTKPFLCLRPPPVARHDEKRRKTLGSLVKSTFTISPTPSSSSNSVSPAATSSTHTTYGGGRKKISDKIRSLEKLMPWEKKMEMATILEEAHKYIRFLQSQIASLRWMPLESVYYSVGEAGETDPLKSLTRQQILQVIANSPGARTVLYTNGVCVFSYEQLLSIQKMTQSARNL